MASNYYDVSLALAGVCQSALLVQQFATKGEADKASFHTSISSLLQTQPENTLAVYGGSEHHLKLGLDTLIAQLNGEAADLTRYWIGLLALASKLDKNPQAKAELAQRIQYLPNQLAHYDLFDEQMLSNIASMYVDIVSPLGSKIYVQGSPIYLQQTATINRIRACLLSGIRSAILWKQVGGSKWQLLFSRRKIIAAAQQIYSSL